MKLLFFAALALGYVMTGYFVAYLIYGDTARGFWILALAGALVLGVMTLGGTWSMRRLRYATIRADEDGLWPGHLQKAEGLVRWADIARTVERAWMQRMDLLDDRGGILLRIEYQLLGYSELRERILACVTERGLPRLPVEYSKGRIYHAGNAAVIALIAAIPLGFAWFSQYGDLSPLYGLAAAAGAVWYFGAEYLREPCGLALTPEHLELRYPLRESRIPYADIESVEIIDEWRSGSRYPGVSLRLRNGKRLRLASLGVEPSLLHRLLARQIGDPKRAR